MMGGRARRAVAGLVTAGLAAILVAVAVVVPLVSNNATAGSPSAAAGASTSPSPSPTPPPEPDCRGAPTIVAWGSAFTLDAIRRVGDDLTALCPSSEVIVGSSEAGTESALEQLVKGEADLAAADQPLSAEEIAAAKPRCGGLEPVQLPIVLTPVALPYNLPGVDTLRLDGPTLADIYSGRITAWNHEKIAALNEGTTLPATPITVMARADGAASTQTLQEYLAATGDWNSGTNAEFSGAVGTTHQGDADLLAAVRATEGAIGYIPHSADVGEPIAQLVTSGNAAAPDANTVEATTNAAVRDLNEAQQSVDELRPALYQASTESSAVYPLTHVGYLIYCGGKKTDPAVRDFLRTALSTEIESEIGFQLPAGELTNTLVALVEDGR
jgi:phosphate transport system substrate-binding protein